MCRFDKIAVLEAGTVLVATFLCCEHKKFLNPSDPENLPSPPILLSPANDTTSVQNPPYFQWDIEEDTLNPLCGEELIFEIQIDNTSDFSSVDFGDSTVYYENYIPYFHCGEGSYYWRVRAKYLDGFWGEWSEVCKFDVNFPLIGSYDIFGPNTGYWYVEDIAINDNYVFLASGRYLNVIDISNQYIPNLIATFPETSVVFDYIFVADNYLYTTCNHNYPGYELSLSIYNIENPANPVLSDRYNFPNDIPLDIWVENNYAYICRDGYNILVFDVSNPESVFVVDTLPVSGEKIIIKDNYAYILIENGMRILDLSTNTVISSTYPSGGLMQSFWISDNHAYIAGQHTSIYDISNPYNPSLVSIIDKSSCSITVAKNYLFFTFYDIIGEYAFYSLDIFDIANPLSLTQIGTVYHTDGEILADNNFVYTTKPKFSIFKYE